VWQVSDLEGEVLRLTAQSHADECDGEQNGTVTASDLDQLQKVNKDLEQQLAEKNKVRAKKSTEMNQSSKKSRYFKVPLLCFLGISV